MPPSSSTRGKPFSLTSISFLLVALSVSVKIAGSLWLDAKFKEVSRKYTYVGNDYPETWPIQRKPVLMAFDNPKHFRLDTEDGIAEWAAIIPGDGIVYLGPYKQPYTVSMFHQLKCLDIMRAETVRDRDGEESTPSPLGRHCLNYIRQMVTCRGDWELESFQFASHRNPINLHGIYECKDWGAVYSEAKENQRSYERWLTTQ